jgi:hypothetical protein
MEVPQETVEKWQAIWRQVCDMAYYRKNITTMIIVPICDYSTLVGYSRSGCTNFEQITLDYEWQKISSVRGENGDCLDALVVPELTEMYVPRILFETLGVFPWFQHSFPNCTILFWEDELE